MLLISTVRSGHDWAAAVDPLYHRIGIEFGMMLLLDVLRSGGPDDGGCWPLDPAAFEGNYCENVSARTRGIIELLRRTGMGQPNMSMLPTLCWLTNGLQGDSRDQRAAERQFPRE
jgi:hypothetical protein